MRSIRDYFVHDDPDCPWCRGCGHVCEDHPDQPWYPASENGCPCRAPGMPCPAAPLVPVPR